MGNTWFGKIIQAIKTAFVSRRVVRRPIETYVCSMCGGEYEKGWSDEEAFKEKDTIWGKIPIEDCAIVCDDCFKIMMN